MARWKVETGIPWKIISSLVYTVASKTPCLKYGRRQVYRHRHTDTHTRKPNSNLGSPAKCTGPSSTYCRETEAGAWKV